MARDMVSVPKVYLAGSSAEMERAKHWHDRLRAAGVDVVASWIETDDPRSSSWPIGKRRLEATGRLAEAGSAPIVWFLVPTLGIGGAWAEVGFVYGASWQACLKLVFSGNTKQSVFCSLGTEYSTDEDAFAGIGAWEPIES